MIPEQFKKKHAKLINMVQGAYSIFNIAGDPIKLPIRSDVEALQSDWEAIGGDMWKVIDEIDKELERST